MIELVDVSRRYGDVAALAGVTLSIAAGEVVAIVGPSGSGKSTLLSVIGAIDRPTSGTVRVDGQDVGALDDAGRTALRRDRIGFVFQAFHLLPTLSAIENVMLPALLAGASRGVVGPKAVKALDALGLAARRDHRPAQLSGGEQQRVAIARALLADPPIVLADEPTGNLDSATGEEILGLLFGARSAKRTVVIVTHDARIAARADRVISLRDGRLAT